MPLDSYRCVVDPHSAYTPLSKEVMSAAVVGCRGRGPHVMKKATTGLDPALKSTDTTIEIRYCNAYLVQELGGLRHPIRQRSKTSKQERILSNKWVGLLVIERGRNTTLYSSWAVKEE